MTANNSCGSSAQQTINITVNTIDNTVSISGIILTSNQSGATYQWLDCNNGNSPVPGATAQSFTPSVNGSYAVQVTNNSCTETSTCITVNSIGIETLEQNELNIFPNPGNGLFTISTEAPFNNATVVVYSISGQVIMSRENIFGKEVQVDLLNQPSGIFYVQLNNQGGSSYSKIIKQ